MGLCIMGYVSTWPNAKTIGKEYDPEVLKMINAKKKEIELEEAKVDKPVEALSTEAKDVGLADNSLQSVKGDKAIPVAIPESNPASDVTPTESPANANVPLENSSRIDAPNVSI